jgi:hypothetical protein
MNSEYYQKHHQHNSDGTLLRQSPSDEAAEREIAASLEAKWSCQLHKLAALSPVDYYAVRDGRIKSVIEIKDRAITSTQYETVFLSVRKWLSLLLASTGLNVPALYVVRFLDGIRWVNVSAVSAANIQIGGEKNYGTRSGRHEPIILVPIKQMEAL